MSGRYRYCRFNRFARVAALRLAFALASVFAAGAGVAGEARYAFDPVHTRVAFQVSHAGFSNPVGTFSRIEGELQFDEADWSSARLKVRIPMTTLELGDADWREKILDRTFFDAEKFPEAVFESTTVESTGSNTANVSGNLTMHGVTRPVTLAVTMNALRRHPLTFKRTAGFSATASLKRSDFGMTSWKNLVGDDVRLLIEAEAVRDSADGDVPKVDEVKGGPE
ncbi:MAG: hypothetical protein A3E01_02555 [Gammaproteobacteria bacterium RIFCSPHIGHO2_12_FULL_63_22]|nr:MAG: hypothetical protein A3E01_02555 [Gammaproteobacteria bacterium RIFCSPHIGHO2_12_FULL_63_22]